VGHSSLLCEGLRRRFTRKGDAQRVHLLPATAEWGVLSAVLVPGFNDHVTDVDLADIRGARGIGHDEGTWLTAIHR
jgi:hypothetical protein